MDPPVDLGRTTLLKRLEKVANTSGKPARVAIAYISNLDLGLQATDLFASLELTPDSKRAPTDFSKIQDSNQLLATFEHFFQQGAVLFKRVSEQILVGHICRPRRL